MNQPVRLTVIVPASGEPIETELGHPAGFQIQNLNLPTLGGSVLTNPVSQISKALESDGYSPVVNFALIGPDGRVLHRGPINADMIKRQQAEQALRDAAMNTRQPIGRY
jgi:hypothetical protein